MSAIVKRVGTAGVIAAALLGAGTASAFCQATTCDPSQARCAPDKQNCLTVGAALSWASNCITVSVQAAGAPKQHIDYEAAFASVGRAFAAWTSAGCAGGAPSLQVQVEGPISCGASEYNPDRGNANVVVFREDTWPYVGGEDALGLTFLRFDTDTGEIWDADIEVNAVAEPLSVGAPQPKAVDLDSLLTHEAGHLLGLGHTKDPSATMFAGYKNGTIELRTLAPDDVSGICKMYPSTRQASSTSCEPRHGYSDLCGAQQTTPLPDGGATSSKSGGCNAASRPAGSASWLAFLALLGGVVLRRQRR